MEDIFIRTEALLGAQGLTRLKAARVALFGIGGVGSYAAEALVRSGIGFITLIDGDTVAHSNLNRQLIALHSTIGLPKAEVMAARALDINPDCRAVAVNRFYTEENKDIIDFSQYDHVIDAIDMVSSKLLIIESAKRAGVPVISAMGAGNKLDPAAFEVADIFSTSVCPLARVMRRELKKRGIDSLKVVYSREEPVKPLSDMQDAAGTGHRAPGSVAFTPGAAGLILAGEVIKAIALNSK